jgi:hypothetical protein
VADARLAQIVGGRESGALAEEFGAELGDAGADVVIEAAGGGQRRGRMRSPRCGRADASCSAAAA